MKTVILGLAWSLWAVPSWGAAKTVDYFYFKRLANEASHATFLAKLEVGRAQSNIARAEFIHAQKLELAKRNVGTAFEMMDALMRLMESKFEEIRSKFHVEQAMTTEKVWKLRLEALESGKEPVAEVAALYATLATSRLEVFTRLHKDLGPYLELLGEEYKRMTQLRDKGAITRAEHNQIEILHNDYLGLKQEVAEELARAKAEVADTANDLRG